MKTRMMERTVPISGNKLPKEVNPYLGFLIYKYGNQCKCGCKREINIGTQKIVMEEKSYFKLKAKLPIVACENCGKERLKPTITFLQTINELMGNYWFRQAITKRNEVNKNGR